MKRRIIYKLCKLILLVVMVLVVLKLFWDVYALKREMKVLQQKFSVITDKQIEEDRFIKERFSYVYRYVKDKVATYRILKEIKKYSDTFKIDPDLVIALIEKESNFDSTALSNKGAIGLMQLLPETAELMSRLLNKFGYNLNSVSDNLELGIAFLSILLEYYPLESALKRYYAGRLYYTEIAEKYKVDVLKLYANLKNNLLEQR